MAANQHAVDLDLKHSAPAQRHAGSASAPVLQQREAISIGNSVNRRLLLLNGLAIFAVVINHSIQYALITLTQWPMEATLSPAAVIATVGWPRYYVFLALEKLPVFSVPAFLFTSGFFVAYAARADQSGRSWLIIRTRLLGLLIPYLIWSTVILVGQTFRGSSFSPIGFVARLLYGGAIPHYFFVPLLCQLYILSPWLASIARKHGRGLLVVTALVQLTATSVFYLPLISRSPLLLQVYAVASKWSFFPMWIFFFSLGIVAGFNRNVLRAGLDRYRWLLLVLTVGLGGLAIAEADVVYRWAGLNWRPLPLTLPTSLYAVMFLLCFLAFDRVSLPSAKLFYFLSRRTYGIYLLHSTIIWLIAVAISETVPQLLTFQSIVQPVLVGAGIALPLLFMEMIGRSRFSKIYRYLFG